MSDKPIVPEKAGEWWMCKRKGADDCKMSGLIVVGFGNHLAFLLGGNGTRVEFNDYSFRFYDWHRIELPEGWE